MVKKKNSIKKFYYEQKKGREHGKKIIIHFFIISLSSKYDIGIQYTKERTLNSAAINLLHTNSFF